MNKSLIIKALKRLHHFENNQLKEREQRLDYMKHPSNVWDIYPLEQMEKVEIQINNKYLEILEIEEQIILLGGTIK